MSKGCVKLLGVTSSGQRVVCGKAPVGEWSVLCAAHDEYDTPCAITCEISARTAERLAARADAYGVSLGKLIGRMLESGILLNLDAEQ